MYVFALCQKMRVPDTTRGFGRVLFDCLRKFKKKKKKKKKKNWYTSEMGSWYSKIKYRYDSLNKKEPPPEIYSWHFSVQLQ